MGTSVASGTGKALVVATGRKAQLGSIASSLQKPPPPTAFAVGIQNFGLMILRITVFLILFVVSAEHPRSIEHCSNPSCSRSRSPSG